MVEKFPEWGLMATERSVRIGFSKGNPGSLSAWHKYLKV